MATSAESWRDAVDIKEGAAVNFTGERVTPDIMTPGHPNYPTYVEHMARYEFCRPYVGGKAVLDAACGTGYGASYLADFATRVVGVDVDHDAVRYATEVYSKENSAYEVADCRHLPFASRSFDVVVAFEFLEHIQEQEQFLDEVTRVLAEEGVFMLSTPNEEPYNHLLEEPNPFHCSELSLEEFQELMGRHFSRFDLYGQRQHPAFLRSQQLEARVGELEARMQRLPLVVLRGFIPDALLKSLPPGVLKKIYGWYRGLMPQAGPEAGDGRPSSPINNSSAISVSDIEISPTIVADATYLIAVCRK
ncbi:MAG: class I SAM-dependent methyltransferase [Dehalococcoidia bacterium]|nr:class I SAM-dependent methyltransferase [Dehalococcoidia bacterium]